MNPPISTPTTTVRPSLTPEEETAATDKLFNVYHRCLYPAVLHEVNPGAFFRTDRRLFVYNGRGQYSLVGEHDEHNLFQMPPAGLDTGYAVSDHLSTIFEVFVDNEAMGPAAERTNMLYEQAYGQWYNEFEWMQTNLSAVERVVVQTSVRDLLFNTLATHDAWARRGYESAWARVVERSLIVGTPSLMARIRELEGDLAAAHTQIAVHAITG